jgi:hypothetical protein
MAPIRLKKPRDLSTLAIDFEMVNPADVYRVSKRPADEPNFRSSKGNRFDDPKGVYGTCYYGFDTETAISESILHDLCAEHGGFTVSLADVESRYLVRMSGDDLKLAHLYGASLKRLGATGELSSRAGYAITQKWSAEIHGHPDNFDGFIYMSRHLNDRKATVLFDRARPKLTVAKPVKLIHCAELVYAANLLNIKMI